MKIKRSQVIATIVILVVGVVWVKGFWFVEVFHTRERNEPHRTALLQIRGAISIGASHADVLAAYWRHRTNSLRLFAERPAAWAVTMPPEFGASDWTLLIEFQDGRVSAVRVRTSDGPPPEDGPKDKKKQANEVTAPNAGGHVSFKTRCYGSPASVSSIVRHEAPSGARASPAPSAPCPRLQSNGGAIATAGPVVPRRPDRRGKRSTGWALKK